MLKKLIVLKIDWDTTQSVVMKFGSQVLPNKYTILEKVIGTIDDKKDNLLIIF